MKMDPIIFREYDIRGVVNEQFDNNFATELGKALTTYIFNKTNNKNPHISLGYDARQSSPEIIKALSEGITSCGGTAIHLGPVTTPMVYFTTFAYDNIDGAIMVTGSHNPPEYNGFKISVGKGTLFGSEIQELKKIIQSGKYLDSGQGQIEELNIFSKYIEKYEHEFGKLNNIPVVLDCGNGAAGCVARQLYEAVGLEPTILFEEPDGTFPNHHPDPTVAENLEDLIDMVTAKKALCGIGFDGDADRVGLVDDQGKIILGDEIIALCARFILKDNPGQKIIGDVKCSDRMYADIAKHGGEPIMWKTGHSLIKEKIKVEKSPFGGELSGHIFFADRNYGYDDALYAGLRIIEIISKTGKRLSELLEDLPSAYNTPEIRINTTEEKKHQIVDQLKTIYAKDTDRYKVNFTDGVRISFKHGWALARSSNTQPVLVLRFEAETQENLDQIRGEVEAIVNPML